MTSKLSSFFVTQNFDAAWRCYQDWQGFQQSLKLNNQVGLAGCRVNGRICWDVCITQELHDARVAAIDAGSPKPRILSLRAYRWGLLMAVPVAIVGLLGGVWHSSTSQFGSIETEIHEDVHNRLNRKHPDNLVR